MCDKFLINTQSAYISPDEVVVETVNRTWLHQPEHPRIGDSFAQNDD